MVLYPRSSKDVSNKKKRTTKKPSILSARCPLTRLARLPTATKWTDNITFLYWSHGIHHGSFFSLSDVYSSSWRTTSFSFAIKRKRKLATLFKWLPSIHAGGSEQHQFVCDSLIVVACLYTEVGCCWCETVLLLVLGGNWTTGVSGFTWRVRYKEKKVWKASFGQPSLCPIFYLLYTVLKYPKFLMLYCLVSLFSQVDCIYSSSSAFFLFQYYIYLSLVGHHAYPAAWGARKPQQNKLPQSWISYAAAAGQRNKNKETTENTHKIKNGF